MLWRSCQKRARKRKKNLIKKVFASKNEKKCRKKGTTSLDLGVVCEYDDRLTSRWRTYSWKQCDNNDEKTFSHTSRFVTHKWRIDDDKQWKWYPLLLSTSFVDSDDVNSGGSSGIPLRNGSFDEHEQGQEKSIYFHWTISSVVPTKGEKTML